MRWKNGRDEELALTPVQIDIIDEWRILVSLVASGNGNHLSKGKPSAMALWVDASDPLDLLDPFTKKAVSGLNG